MVIIQVEMPCKSWCYNCPSLHYCCCFCFFFLYVLAKSCIFCFLVFPGEFFITSGAVLSVNGSSINGGCTDFFNIPPTFSCQAARSSVIFDGIVPTLSTNDFTGNTWAQQLLTIQPQFGSTSLDLSRFDSFGAAVEAVEIVMFNCPQWGIAVNTIRVFQQEMRPPISCDSLVSVCFTVSTRSLAFINILFEVDFNSEWIHLAEVTLFDSESPINPCQGTHQPFPAPQQTTGVMLYILFASS